MKAALFGTSLPILSAPLVTVNAPSELKIARLGKMRWVPRSGPEVVDGFGGIAKYPQSTGQDR